MLTFTTGQIDGWVGSGLWPLMRIGAMLAVAPIFAGRMISV
ncbi:MAG TPA: flagellar biosynthetic protein FliR, partial [Chromatiales bacterium]|nr:flagellar biosynthetic protein FliR [Chromatiales bacterium]